MNKTLDILETAKEHLLHGGHLPPTFFVSFKGKRQRPLIAVIVNSCEHVEANQMTQFFLAAREVATQGHWKREEIKKIFLVAEAMAELPGKAEPKEILLITTLRMKSMEMSVQCIEKIQGSSGELLDLFSHPETHCKNDEHPALLAFLDGVENAVLSDKELVAMLQGKRR